MVTNKRNVRFTVLHAFVADVIWCNVSAAIRLAVYRVLRLSVNLSCSVNNF
jgi:hypothetical protein